MFRKFINENNLFISMEKRGQVTIFIIVGILLVMGIVLVFMFQNELGITTRINTNPATFIEKCAQDNIKPMVESIIATGGIYYNGTNKNEFLDINGTSISLLCKTNKSETACTSNHPLLINEVERVMVLNSKSKIESCFKQYKNKFPTLQITDGVLDFDLKLREGFIAVKIRKPLTISTGEESSYFENFDTNINSNLFDFLSLSNLIVNTESSCICQYALSPSISEPSQDPFATIIPGIVNCDADLTKLSVTYPDYSFYRTNLNNAGQKIYTISSEYQYSSENFSFAIINCLSDCSTVEGSCK